MHECLKFSLEDEMEKKGRERWGLLRMGFDWPVYQMALSLSLSCLWLRLLVVEKKFIASGTSCGVLKCQPNQPCGVQVYQYIHDEWLDGINIM